MPGSLRRTLGASRPLRLRLQFAGALVVLVLPLLTAAWAFGNYAAANERSRSDTRLTASLRAAASAYARIVSQAELKTLQLASKGSVQRALSTRDKKALARLRRDNPNVQFLTGQPPKASPDRVARRSVNVVVGKRNVGMIVVDVLLDRVLLERIARMAGLSKQVAFAERGGRVAVATAPLSGRVSLVNDQPRTVKVGSTSYRAVAGRIGSQTRLGILEPTHAVDAAATRIRSRIVLVGLLLLAAVMVMAYALAPSIGRARLAQQQRALAEQVLANVADGVLLLDDQGVVRFWNRAAETITGLSADDVLDSAAEQAIPGWQVAAARIPIWHAHQLEGTVTTATVPLEIAGRELWLAASGVRFAEGTVYSFRDISEDERLDKAKTDFVATVSHELRTPLASVYGAALTLKEHFSRLDKAQRDRLLELIAEEADRLSAIIDDILLASRLDSGRLDVERESFEADEVARAVVEAAQVRAPEEIAIVLSTPPSLPAATGDGDKVGQVLANLVENAVKYSPGGGRVDVRVDHDAGHIHFEVRDEGLGIPLDEQERIFKKFYRLDPNLTRGIGGTGLGLYICDELVRRMGAKIHVTSAPGQGSAFSFELPAARSPERVAEPIGSG